MLVGRIKIEGEKIMKDINEKGLKQKIQNKENFIIQFSANWCGPCKSLTPVLEELCDKNKIEVFKFDISSNPEYARSQNIRSIPLVVFYKNGIKTFETLGAKPKDTYLEKINEIFKD